MPAPNYNTFYPSGYAQQLQIARSQALAQALTQESQAPIQYDERGKISPFQGLNKMAQALTGNMAFNKEIQEAQQYGQGAQANLNQMFPPQQGNPQALAAGLSGQGDAGAQGSAPPQNAGAAPQGGGLPSATGNPNADKMLFMTDQMNGTNEYGKALAARLAPTNEQKLANAAYGEGTPEAIQGLQAEVQKAGNIPPVDVKEGGSVLNPHTMQPVFNSPKNGIQVNYGPGGQAYANPVPGYAPAAANQAGQVKGAEEGSTIFPNQVVNGREGVPVTGATIQGNQPGQNAPVSPAPGTAAQSPGVPPSAVAQSIANNNPPPETGIPASQIAPPTLNGSPAPASPAPPAGVQFGAPLGAKSGAQTSAEDSAKNIIEASKTFAVANAGLPQVLQRLQDMQAVAKDASYGAGINAEGEGIKPIINNQFNTNTSQANAIMRQKPAQNIIAELGPQLAQGGMRGNKFLETLSSKASGINLDDSPSGKAAAINGLQQTYIGNLKAEAAAIRAQGGNAPADADIDAQVAKISSGLHQEGQTATNPQTGQKAVYHYGQWAPQ